jgi:pimeloyl-ACP methyl ester carboxylesterase
MIFFSGFSLRNEQELFLEYLKGYVGNPYVIAGFSYGAIKALEYTLQTDRRIDKLILLSPAWFKNKSRAFVKTQLIHYRKDPDKYIETFFKNASYPSSTELEPYRASSEIEELEELLTYSWPEEKLQTVVDRKIDIETCLGARDRIVDALSAHDFFKNFSTSYLFKPFGHLLR